MNRQIVAALVQRHAALRIYVSPVTDWGPVKVIPRLQCELWLAPAPRDHEQETWGTGDGWIIGQMSLHILPKYMQLIDILSTDKSSIFIHLFIVFMCLFLVNVTCGWMISRTALAVMLQSTQNVKLHHPYPSFPSRYTCTSNLNDIIFWSFQRVQNDSWLHFDVALFCWLVKASLFKQEV